jgi:hypothetical protein
MITQLDPPLPMTTPKGDGWAHFLIDYGPEAALMWVVFMDADGACWTVPNPEVRMYKNWTLGRQRPEDSKKSGDQAAVAAAATPAPARFRPSLAHQSDS